MGEFWDGLDLMDLDPFICGFLLCSDWAFEESDAYCISDWA